MFRQFELASHLTRAKNKNHRQCTEKVTGDGNWHVCHQPRPGGRYKSGTCVAYGSCHGLYLGTDVSAQSLKSGDGNNHDQCTNECILDHGQAFFLLPEVLHHCYNFHGYLPSLTRTEIGMVCRPLWWAHPPSWGKEYALPPAPSIGKSLHFALGQTGKPTGSGDRDKHPDYPGLGLREPTSGFIEQGEEGWRIATRKSPSPRDQAHLHGQPVIPRSCHRFAGKFPIGHSEKAHH